MKLKTTPDQLATILKFGNAFPELEYNAESELLEKARLILFLMNIIEGSENKIEQNNLIDSFKEDEEDEDKEEDILFMKLTSNRNFQEVFERVLVKLLKEDPIGTGEIINQCILISDINPNDDDIDGIVDMKDLQSFINSRPKFKKPFKPKKSSYL